MYTLISKHNLDTAKISLFATLFGVVLMFIGAICVFGPIMLDNILPKQLVYQMVNYQWLPISIMTVGVLLNILSYKLNSQTSRGK